MRKSPQRLRPSHTYLTQNDRIERLVGRLLVSASVPPILATLLWQRSRAAALAAAVIGAVPLVIHGVQTCRVFVRKGQ